MGATQHRTAAVWRGRVNLATLRTDRMTRKAETYIVGGFSPSVSKLLMACKVPSRGSLDASDAQTRQ
eukprot:752563-Hanusia_phi.AAC.7